MDKPLVHTLVPQRRGVERWPVTSTTERANPLRRWNPDWGGYSTARRPAAAVNQSFPEALGFCQAASSRDGYAAAPSSEAIGGRRRRSIEAREAGAGNVGAVMRVARRADAGGWR